MQNTLFNWFTRPPEATQETTPPIPPPPPPEPVLINDAALIATFYGARKKERLQPLVARLIQLFSLTEYKKEGVVVDDNWLNEEGPIFLRRFDPSAAPDATVVQLALNEAGEAATAWAAMRERLEGVLDDESLQIIWGYSLIYQAVWQADTLPEPDHPLLNELALNVRRLHAASGAKTFRLAQADMPGGRLWLTTVPLERDGVQAGTVYVAVGPADVQNQLVQEVLYGPAANLLMPDLIAHKGYHQRRQYRQDNLKQRYEGFANSLRETSGELLTKLANNQYPTKELNELTKEYQRFLAAVPLLRELRISLARQEHNYNKWREQVRNEIIDFHGSHIDTAFREIELLVMIGEDTQAAVETTINMVQTRLDRAKEEREQTLQNWLAIIAIVLAVPQLVNENVADALLNLFSFYLQGVPISPDSYQALRLLAIQAVAMIIVLLVWLLIAFVRKRSAPLSS